MEKNEYGDLFPMDVMQHLMDGFYQLKDGKDVSFCFLDVLNKDLKFEIQNFRYLLACYPVNEKNFLAGCCSVNEGAKLYTLSEYRCLMNEMNENPNNLPFMFSMCAHLGAFQGKKDFDYSVLLRELKALCRKVLPRLEYMHPAARQRLRLLVDEVLGLDRTGNCFFFDFETTTDLSLFDPLSQKRIDELTKISNRLVADRNRYFMIQSQRDAFEILRFYASAPVKGYEKVSEEAAKTLLKKSIWWDDSKFQLSPYLITSAFEDLCFDGDDPYKVLAMAKEHRGVLLRAYRYPRFCRSTEEAFCRFMAEPSRLAHGIATSIKNGSLAILEAFLTEEFGDARQMVDNRVFVDDLCSILVDPSDLSGIAGIYAKNRSLYVDTIRLYIKRIEDEDRTLYPRMKFDNSHINHFLDEEQLIGYELGDWGRWYDDRNAILKAVLLPDFDEWGPLLRMGYSNDPVVATAIIHRFPEASKFIPTEVLQAITKEREEEKNDDE